MPREPNPFDDEELFDSIEVAGVRSPGKVTLSGHDRDIGWDVKKGNGQKGASMTRTSEDPIPFKASFDLRDREEVDAWPAFRDLLKSTIAGPQPKALDVYHPDLAEVGITSVVLKKLCGTVHDGKGGQTKVVELQEYFPPKAAGGSPAGSKAKPSTDAKPDPDAAALAELKKLTDEYEKTPWS